MSWHLLGKLLDSPGGGEALIPNEGIKLPSDPGLTALTASKRCPGQMRRSSKGRDRQWLELKAVFPWRSG